MTDGLLTQPDIGPDGHIRRDRWGRYLLPHPETGIEQAWTRVTTLSSTLADRFGLEKWMQRNIVYGLGQRQDLYARAAAATLDDKDTLTRIVEEAQTAAADKAGANLGSAIHQFTERIDRGEKLQVPPPYDADIAAYQQVMGAAGVTVMDSWVERVVVVPDIEVVGTLDRLCNGMWPLPRVADVKTGKDVVRWGMAEIPLQLALYAHGTHWWTGTNWQPMPLVDRETAIVIHLPVGQGHCTLYEVDIEAGWEAVQLAVAVRDWRKRKDLAQQIPTFGQGTVLGPSPPPTARVNWIKAWIEMLAKAGNLDELALRWPQGVPTTRQGGWTSSDIDRIAALCTEIDARTGRSFWPPDPTHQPMEVKRP